MYSVCKVLIVKTSTMCIQMYMYSTINLKMYMNFTMPTLDSIMTRPPWALPNYL